MKKVYSQGLAILHTDISQTLVGGYEEHQPTIIN